MTVRRVETVGLREEERERAAWRNPRKEMYGGERGKKMRQISRIFVTRPRLSTLSGLESRPEQWDCGWSCLLGRE